MTGTESTLPCFVCGTPMTLGLCRPNKAGKRSLHIRCPKDGRHLRGFIAHQPLVEEVLDQVQRMAPGEGGPPEEQPAPEAGGLSFEPWDGGS